MCVTTEIFVVECQNTKGGRLFWNDNTWYRIRIPKHCPEFLHILQLEVPEICLLAWTIAITVRQWGLTSVYHHPLNKCYHPKLHFSDTPFPWGHQGAEIHIGITIIVLLILFDFEEIFSDPWPWTVLVQHFNPKKMSLCQRNSNSQWRTITWNLQLFSTCK